jgi:predicted nuclease with TOPRIM domain
MKDYKDLIEERDRMLKGFRYVAEVYEQQPVVEADWLNVKIGELDKVQISHLEKEIRDTKEKAQALNAENNRLRKQCETLSSDTKRLENEVNRLNQSLDAFSKIQIMDAAEIEHWKSTVEVIAKSDQKANYLPRSAIVSVAKNAMKGPPK